VRLQSQDEWPGVPIFRSQSEDKRQHEVASLARLRVVRQKFTDTCDMAWLLDSALTIATGELVVGPGVLHITLHKTVSKGVSVTYLNTPYVCVLYIHI
jgi:hypothetical protein